jgi:hypothetical protein
MARTPPTSPGGMAAMIAHARRELALNRVSQARFDEHYGDWVTLALKTVGAALARMAAA